MLSPDTLLQNRYRILRLLGKGGMGAVYQAQDERLGCTVAVKQAFFIEEELQRAFLREARLLANLRHHGLPKVIDHFMENDGQFLVMEFIPGKDLHQMLKERNTPFPVAQVLDWADQLLDVLEFLHSQNPPIIHRDIKPANIKLTYRGEIILLDFGLAKGLASSNSSQTSVSVVGYSAGYAPVEQIQLTGTDQRTDLYALGATLFHLMTGSAPPDALTARAVNLAIGNRDPLRGTHELNPQVPVSVATVLAQALAFSRDQRLSSAVEMRQKLRAAGMHITQSPARGTSVINLDDAPTVITPRLNQPPPETKLQTQLPFSGELTVTGQPIKNKLGMEFLMIPAGEFLMGSPVSDYEKPQHLVKISKPFYLGKFPVTQKEWKALMKTNPSRYQDELLPVTNVSWDDAQLFIQKLNQCQDGVYRLPTEAEWEYACRAGTTAEYAGELKEMGWFKENTENRPHPVGLKKPNAFGLFDMHGNIWEWCSDWYGSNYYEKSPTIAPPGPGTGSFRINRGGSWMSVAIQCRSAFRGMNAPGTQLDYLGFRLVRLIS